MSSANVVRADTRRSTTVGLIAMTKNVGIPGALGITGGGSMILHMRITVNWGRAQQGGDTKFLDTSRHPSVSGDAIFSLPTASLLLSSPSMPPPLLSLIREPKVRGAA